MGDLLQLVDLRVEFPFDRRTVHAINGLSLTINAGRTVTIVGESGSGKSTLAHAIMGLLPPPGIVRSGEILFRGRDILGMGKRALRSLRGNDIAMVVQNPMGAFDPVYTVGAQITEALHAHTKIVRTTARKRAVELLTQVGVPDPVRRFGQYPHQFSGGMSQRALIAMALAGQPELLIADEPTSALDVTVQAQIIELLGQAREVYDLALLLITHDLRLAAAIADEVVVMYAGRIVEHGNAERVLCEPEHPYTVALLTASAGGNGGRRSRLPAISGAPPDATNLPSGCKFHPRCPYVMDVCRTEDPPLLDDRSGHLVACHLSSPRRRELATNRLQTEKR